MTGLKPYTKCQILLQAI
uniref:Uncharacterized protein n=1 Tax=Macrostomum lignano TaxID=282301 RepID=A0A1I8I2M7_9PLAT